MEGMPCSSTTRPHREMSLQATSRSQHDGGVYVLMADGSAHFVSNDVAPTIWHNMHKRDNQVPIELPF
jgi:prepilin-type processing-associated H-X9-DG protein